MKKLTLILSLKVCALAATTLLAQTNRIAIFPEEDTQTPENLLLVWPATPGVRYEVRQSTNLQTWTTPPGFPASASGPAQAMPFAATNSAVFFRVAELDEQPPSIRSQYPQDGGFAVPRFADLTLQLSDATGLDPNSIQLTAGALGTFTVTNSQITFTNGLLTFDSGGDIALGSWGSNVIATLVVADRLGNRGTNTWSFTLEIQPQVVTNLFVFGSPKAQRAGQRIGNIPTASLASRFGPVPMGAGDPWALELVESNRLVLSYTSTAPGITNGTYLCNLTPTRLEEVFYRKVTSVSNAPASKFLTLWTINVPLAEILLEGSASVSKNSVIYQVDTNNVVIRAFSFDHEIVFDPLGVDTNKTLYDQGGVRLTLEEAKFLFAPSLALSFETRWLRLQRFKAELRGHLETALVPQLTLAGSFSGTKEFDLYSHKLLVFVGAVGPVPIWLDFDFNLGAEVGYDLVANATMTTGVRQNMDLSFGVDYVKDRTPALDWHPSVTLNPMEIVPFTYQINGTARTYATIIPQIDLRVNSLAGVYANVDPRVEISGSATLDNGQLSSANFAIVADADLNIGLSVIGLDSEDLPALPPFNLFRKEWSSVYPPPGQLTIQNQPQSVEVAVGSSATFSVDAVSGHPISYQWYWNGVVMPGQTARTLLLPSVTYGHAGNYHVRVSASSQTSNSAPATLTVVTAGVPSSMVLIPAGSFTMGDTFNEGATDERPVHTVHVSAFYMDRTEVTKELWDEVYQWAVSHGYSFDHAGSGRAANHPVHSVSWHDVVKWCNARSEKEGLGPAYYTSSGQTTVYRTGQVNVQNNSVKWNTGYRLPTEAEWEKGARGGLAGRRFPWGDTISQSQANFSSSGTSTVGSFAANGYGLYDIAGNVWEWCWDWRDTAWYGNAGATQNDTRGPVGPLTYRALRGGSWRGNVNSCRCAVRSSDLSANDAGGFRCVKTALGSVP